MEFLRIVSETAILSCEHGTTVSATSVRFDEDALWVALTNGMPLAWFPRLLRAQPAEREQVG
jgi:hypothetical protein